MHAGMHSIASLAVPDGLCQVAAIRREIWQTL